MPNSLVPLRGPPTVWVANTLIRSSDIMADKIEPQVAYHSVSSEMDSTDSPRPKIELGNHSQSSQKRGIIVTFIVQIFALLWLVPVGVLLWLNFSGYIIGATAW